MEPNNNFRFKVLRFFKFGNRYNFPTNVDNRNYFEFSNKDFMGISDFVDINSEDFKQYLICISESLLDMNGRSIFIPILSLMPNVKEKLIKEGVTIEELEKFKQLEEIKYKSYIYLLPNSKLTKFSGNNYDESYMPIFIIHEFLPECCTAVFADIDRYLYKEVRSTELKTLDIFYKQFPNISIEKYTSIIDTILKKGFQTEEKIYLKRRIIDDKILSVNINILNKELEQLKNGTYDDREKVVNSKYEFSKDKIIRTDYPIN